jgi:hypothetical protein
MSTAANKGIHRIAYAPRDSWRCRGRFAPSTIAADDHPQAARRFAPHNQRMQQSIPSASKLASGLAADPQQLGGQKKRDKGLSYWI